MAKAKKAAKKVAEKTVAKTPAVKPPATTPIVKQQPFTPQVVLKGYDGKNREVLLTQISTDKFIVEKVETNYKSKKHLRKKAQDLFDDQVTCTQN